MWEFFCSARSKFTWYLGSIQLICPHSRIPIIIDSVYTLHFEMATLKDQIKTWCKGPGQECQLKITESAHTDLKEQTVELWWQIININKWSLLFHFCIEIDNVPGDMSIIRDINLGWPEPFRPLFYWREYRRNAAICSVPSIVTLHMQRKITLEYLPGKIIVLYWFKCCCRVLSQTN